MVDGIQLLLWLSGRSIQLYPDPQGYAYRGNFLFSIHSGKGAVRGTSGSNDPFPEECLV